MPDERREWGLRKKRRGSLLRREGERPRAEHRERELDASRKPEEKKTPGKVSLGLTGLKTP